jgi:hypothetical protein
VSARHQELRETTQPEHIIINLIQNREELSNVAGVNSSESSNSIHSSESRISPSLSRNFQDNLLLVDYFENFEGNLH